MTRDDIQAGDIITLCNNNKFRIVHCNGFLYLLNTNTWCTQSRLDGICNKDLTNVSGKCTIDIIERDGKMIWHRPVEMTVSEIEKALRLSPGCLRIKY